MITCSNGTIKLSKGDDAQINLTILKNNVQEYDIKSTDEITFSLFESGKDSAVDRPIVLKIFTKPDAGKTTKVVNTVIRSDETKWLDASKEYFYTIVIVHNKDVEGVRETRETINYGSFYLVK